MSSKVIMIKNDFSDVYRIQKEYTSHIPMEIIAQLTFIEKRDWPLFKTSPYSMFGEFIYRNLSNYPRLKGYINKHNYKFEFIYEFITDQAELIHTSCFQNDIPITEHTFSLCMHRKNYFERWMMVEPFSSKTFIFFDYTCEYDYPID